MARRTAAEQGWGEPVVRELDAEVLEVLGLLARGCTTQKVARLLGVSERTVRRRLRAATEHLGVGSTIEAVVLAVRRGLI